MCGRGEREREGGWDINMTPQGPFRSLKKSRKRTIFENAKYDQREKPQTREDEPARFSAGRWEEGGGKREGEGEGGKCFALISLEAGTQ